MAAPIERRQATPVARFARGDVHLQHRVSMRGRRRVVRARLSAAIGVCIDTRGRAGFFRNDVGASVVIDGNTRRGKYAGETGEGMLDIAAQHLLSRCACDRAGPSPLDSSDGTAATHDDSPCAVAFQSAHATACTRGARTAARLEFRA
ncbi:hypothetical protein [Burkholderia multivorans]|uniref:hypothetical protein n=1 Tax=Burkholderia multivorans TaxID=87883 RepID=UPI001F466174|nr:hypothetical protein [Burkholderia multivorans]